jgi:peroxiredoxin
MRRRLFLAAAAAVPALRAAAIPRPAPMKSYPAPAGRRINLAAYTGKVIALEFLNTTCPACQDCAQTLQRLYNHYGARGFQPLGVATNVTADNAGAVLTAFQLRHGLTFPIGWCATWDEVREFLQLSVFDPPRVPQLAFIDRKALIRAQYSGNDAFLRFDKEKNMRGQIEALLK